MGLEFISKEGDASDQKLIEKFSNSKITVVKVIVGQCERRLEEKIQGELRSENRSPKEAEKPNHSNPVIDQSEGNILVEEKKVPWLLVTFGFVFIAVCWIVLKYIRARKN